MFATPRPKKSLLPPPSRKRKTVHAIEEITFDKDARVEYLTGFRKRKQARIKQAQDIAKEKARLEKIEMRKQIREEKKQEMEDHIQKVQTMLREARHAGAEGTSDEEAEEEWDGLSDEEASKAAAPAPPLDLEEEYIDEDRYTTVTIAAVNIDRDGIHKPGESDDEAEHGGEKPGDPDKTAEETRKPSKEWPKKKKKQKFRYESKHDRRITERKQRAKKSR